MVRRKLVVGLLLAVALGGCKNNNLLDAVRLYHQLALEVEPPRFSVAEGTYHNEFTVTMSSDTEAVSFRYTIDGSTPRSDYGEEYTGIPILIDETTTLKAVAYLSGQDRSSRVTTAVYTLKAATPTQIAEPPGDPPGLYPVAGTEVTITLASITTGASIRYAMDGEPEPTGDSGTVYSGAFIISETKTVRAVAYRSGFEDSEVSEEAYSIGMTANPTISPDGGTFDNDQTVTLSCLTPGATIRYTTDGSDPTEASTLYTAPFTIGSPATLKAVGYHPSLSSSEVVTAVFEMKAADPVFDVEPGTYYAPFDLYITTATSGADIYYTTDGTDPTPASSPLPAAPDNEVQISQTTTLKARAYRNGWTESAVTSGTYTLKVSTPEFSPAGGHFTTKKEVAISCATPGAAIYYTTDDSTPTTSSTPYAEPVVADTTMSIKAIAVKSGWQESEVGSANFIYPCPPPEFSPAPGTYSQEIAVEITAPTIGAEIRYTTDGTDPTPTSSLLPEEPNNKVTISQTTTLKAVAYKSGWDPSAATSGTYTLKAAAPKISPDGATAISAQDVTLSTTTTGASTRYTTDGSNPSSSHGTLYTGPFSLAGCTTLRAVAYKSGCSDSSVASAAFHIVVPIYASETSPPDSALGTRGSKVFVAYGAGDTKVSVVRASRSEDLGDTWKDSTVGNYRAARMDMYVDESGVYLLFYDPSSRYVYFAFSKDGASFQVFQVNGIAAGGGSITKFEDILYEAHYGIEGLYFGSSYEGGKNWGVKLIDESKGVGRNPSISVDGDVIYISYYDTQERDLKLARSTDGGKSWDKRVAVSMGDVGLYSNVFTLKGSDVSVTYYDATNGELKLVRSNDGGTSWSSTTIDSRGAGEYLASVTGVPGTAFVSYARDECLMVAHTKDYGDTWRLSAVEASRSEYEVQWTSIALSGSVVCASYSSGNTLWFVKSLDGGETW